jgi:hypothetical protein
MDQRLVAACKRGVRSGLPIIMGRADLHGRGRLMRAVWMDQRLVAASEGGVGSGSTISMLACVIDDNLLARGAARTHERDRR